MNLIELIKAVKPRAALFTTYTVCIGFIEGVLLPTLRQVGCRDVDILVDANEAASSLDEVQSNSAGRKYRLVPVRAPGGGIFHPKLAYLVGANFDVLSVGSGNLTLPGQSRQLECFDAVRSDLHPGVFMEFSSMASDLAGKLAGTSQQGMSLLRMVAEAAKAASVASPIAPGKFPQEPRLIHTVNSSAASQLIELCRSQTFKASDLTVLSPFHAPDCGPVLSLKNELGAPKLHIGLDRATYVAPFEKKKVKVGTDLDFVVPKLDDDSRHLHAKVFEISNGSSSIVMTGSINATGQSLNTTQNIEVAIARLLPIGSFNWEKAEPSKFEPRTFVSTQREPDFAFLDATLGTDGRISGQLSGAEALPAQASAKLLQGNEEVNADELIVQIQPAGTFSFAAPFEIAPNGAVQLAMTAHGLSAKCWLNIEEDLTSTDEERREKQAIRHILTGEFGDEDVFELLQILTRATQVTTVHRGGDKPNATKNQEMSQAEREQKFSYAQWKNSNVRTSQQGLLGLHGINTLKAFFRWLNNSGTRPTTEVESTSQSAGNEHKPEFKLVEASETPTQSFDFSETLQAIIQAIPRVIASNAKSESAAVLATVAGTHALKISLSSTWRDERAYQPLLSWLDEFSRFVYPENGHEVLVQFALGACAVVVGIADQYGSHRPLTLLKDNLLRFNPHWLGSMPTQEDLEASLTNEIFHQVPNAIRLSAGSSLNDMWSSESMDERIEALLANARQSGYAATETDEREFPGIVSGIRRLLQVDRKRRYHGVVLNERQLESSGCPHCYQSFSAAVRVELRARHLITCPNSSCKKPIFYFEDKAVQQRVMEVIKNA
jgi:hypothetical protein